MTLSYTKKQVHGGEIEEKETERNRHIKEKQNWRLEGSDEHPDVSSDANWDHGGFLDCAATRGLSGSMTLQGL